MKLLIEIPQEFEGHYFRDGFDDSLERLKQDAHLIAGNYEKELVDMLIDAFQKAQIYIDLSPQWIPVTERFPGREWVLCKCRAEIYEVLCLRDGSWYHDPQHQYMSGFVTHWMPLPEPPKEEET